MTAFVESCEITLEPAAPIESDARLVMKWRNEVHTRAMSYHTDCYAWEEFWPAYRDRYFVFKELPPLFACVRGERMGFLRFRPYDFHLSHARRTSDIGINIAPEWRGQGYGTAIIRAATSRLFELGFEQVVAEIRPENSSSQHAFARAGYILMDYTARRFDELAEPIEVYRYIALRSPVVRARVKWVFLDLDGTMADSMPVLYETYRTFLLGFGCEGTRAEFDEMVGPAMNEVLVELKARHQLPGAISALRERYFAQLGILYAKSVEAMPGALDLLRWLRCENIRIALVTASLREWVEPFLARQGWSRLFDAVICGDDVDQAKPNPAIYRLALEQAGCSSPDAIAVEDSPNGVRAAVGAELTCIGLAREHRDCELLELGAQASVGYLSEIPALIERWERS